MEEENLILEHWKKQRQDFEKLLKSLEKRISKKAVHDIRVCVKKMKAYRKLYYLLNPSKTKIKLRETNELYDVLGKLRNIHICLKSIDEYEKESNAKYYEFKTFLHLTLRQAIAWAKQALKRYNDKDISAFEIILQTEPIQQQVKRIEEQVKNNMNDLDSLIEQTHQLRIHLKRTYYWAKILPDKQIEKKYELDKIEDVLDKLGVWQDNEILMQEIKYFRKINLPSQFEEYQSLKELKKTILDNKNMLKEESLSILPIAHESLH